MVSSKTILELKELSEGLTFLYVEDNEKLRKKVFTLLSKLLTSVHCASNGEEGLKIFKDLRPEVVITDIKMPKLNGLDMIEKIRHIAPSTKIIITSAFSDKEFLFRSIELGVFNYLQKPLKTHELINVIIKCITSINMDENSSLFNTYIQQMINYHNDPIALMSNDKPLFVNQVFLDFFDVENLDKFDEKYKTFGDTLLEHKGFLFNNDERSWFDEVSKNTGKLYHIKILDKDGSYKHFILKMQAIPNKDHMYTLSLSDITDLNLMSLFDSASVNRDNKKQAKNTIINLMKVIHSNGAEVKLHNFYKGLAITNHASIVDIQDTTFLIKSQFTQQKAIQYQNSTIMSSEVFPAAILCDKIVKNDLSDQIVSFEGVSFLEKNPTQRVHVRVFPDEKHTVSLFVDDRKFFGEVRIYDLSIDAVKLELNALPAGLKVDKEVSVNMVLEKDRKPVIVHVTAKVFRIDEADKSYYLVVKPEVSGDNKKNLVSYVAKRQMELIREFKGLQYG